MNTKLIKYNSSNTQCILFFNGWGMDSNAIHHLETTGFDVFEFHDYATLELPNIDLQKYSNIYLVAWSMGVWASKKVFTNSSIQFTKTIAINGTEMPMHNTYGIVNDVFTGTLENWNDTVRTKFNIRMCGGRSAFQLLQKNMSLRSIENQKQELQIIYNAICNGEVPSKFVWNSALIGEQDSIFTPENQKKYWLGKTNWFTLPFPHYPFERFNSWKQIIDFGE